MWSRSRGAASAPSVAAGHRAIPFIAWRGRAGDRAVEEKIRGDDKVRPKGVDRGSDRGLVEDVEARDVDDVWARTKAAVEPLLP